MAFMDKELIFYLNKVKPPYNVSQLNQREAFNALREPGRFETMLNTILGEKQKLKVALNSLDMVQKVFPSDANFFLVQISNAKHVYKRLLDSRIIVRDRSNVVPDCIRITVGTPEENQELINALKKIENEKSIVY